MKHVLIRDLQLIDYKEAWQEQERLFDELSQSKMRGAAVEHNHLLLCEHPHVYTLGQRGAASNLLVSNAVLNAMGADFVKTNRGGDITYHGPGQLVAYPICDQEQLGLGLRAYIEAMEQAVIDTLGQHGIAAGRLLGATGVWLDPERPGHERKICAIGVRASRHITMHGLALNVNTDMRYFAHINPCGFACKQVTSMQQELNGQVDMDAVKGDLVRNLCHRLGLAEQIVEAR